jgi:hypothetical protein
MWLLRGRQGDLRQRARLAGVHARWLRATTVAPWRLVKPFDHDRWRVAPGLRALAHRGSDRSGVG